MNDERAQKQWNAEVDRHEKAVGVAGPTGRIRNPHQKFEPPTIVRSKRQSGQESPWFRTLGPLSLSEGKETLDPEELKNEKTQGRSQNGIHYAGGETVPGAILCGDFERHVTEEEQELAHSHE